MNKVDYNKVMRDVAVILMVMFFIFVIYDYMNYLYVFSSPPFYAFVIFRVIVFILPSVILLYLYNQNTSIKISKHEVKSNKFSSEFSYVVAHISDFHNTNSHRVKYKIKKVLEQTRPDAIVITGDLVDSRRTNFDTAKQFLQSIKCVAPIYYVLGNHEARISRIDNFVYDLSKVGIKVLRNETLKVSKKNTTLEFVGLDDPGFYNYIEEETIAHDIQQILINLDSKNDNFRILLTHRPELFDTYSNYNFDLVFTGHAHGGQIRLPILGGIIAPGQGLFPKYTNGMYIKNNTKMIVSRGIGNSKFPFRINNRPDIVIVELKN